MGKLSHIDDFDNQSKPSPAPSTADAAKVEPAPQAAQPTAPAQAEPVQNSVQEQSAAPSPVAKPEPKKTEAAASVNMTAADEIDFHGLNSNERVGAGHGVLIGIAVVLSIAAILYVLNYWFNFI